MRRAPFLALSCLCGVALNTGCVMTNPEIALHMSRVDRSDIVLQVRRSARVTAISDISFWKENAKEYLWRLSIRNAAKSMSIVYGRVPGEPQGRATQVFPAQDAPLSLVPGDTFFVSITYHYDTAFSACFGTAVYKFHVSSEGYLESLGPVPSYKIPEDSQRVQ